MLRQRQVCIKRSQASFTSPARELQIGLNAIIPVEMLPNCIYRSDAYFCGRSARNRNHRSALHSAKLFEVVILVTCNFFKRTIKERSFARNVKITYGQQN